MMDRISELPESLLSGILSYLPVNDSVKTSALSTRWKNQCLNVPVLEVDLKYKDVPFLFMTFHEKFLPQLRLQTFKLKSRIVEIDGLKDRIATVIDHRIQHLYVKSSVFYREEGRLLPFVDTMPLNLYTCKTLVSLKLSDSGLHDPGFVSLPCLKLMHHRDIRWLAPMTLEKLLSGCPLLEELSLLRGVRLLMRNLWLRGIVIVCLRMMWLRGIVIISDFLTGISSVRHMIISQRTVKFMLLDIYSQVKVGPVPKFNNLSRLQAVFASSSLPILPAILESCPNLKHLILVKPIV
ncbi:unnamed protein product [Arabis nemorensis]|uniref:F-box domain-containing protein n=1 Tax=Arabis nemorensis TaxID=586526 RepID=A0A565BKI1_9BRAS|nr:unnamed protein product [Arabis nemorensis]